MAIINVGTRQASNFLSKIVEPYKKEYRQVGMLGKLVGSKNKAIWGKILPRNSGEKIVFNQTQHFMKEPVVGANYNNRLIGDGLENLKIATDEVKIESFRFDSKILNRREITQKTGHDYWPEIRYDLLENARKLKDLRMVNALTRSFYGNLSNGVNRNDGTSINSVLNIDDHAAIINAGSFVTTDLSKLSTDRFMFGNLNNGLPLGDTVVDKCNNLHNDGPIKAGNVLNSETLCNLSVLATNGSRGEVNGTYENAIEPHDFGTHNGYEDRRYVLITTDRAFKSLMLDPEWKAYTQRGVIENNTQPSNLFNMEYKGTMYGISVIVDKSLNKMNQSSNEGVDSGINYSVLLGAGAFGYAIGGEPLLIEDKDDYDNVRGICHDEISGLKVLKFPSRQIAVGDRGKNLYPHVENGLIHVFTTS